MWVFSLDLIRFNIHVHLFNTLDKNDDQFDQYNKSYFFDIKTGVIQTKTIQSIVLPFSLNIPELY